MKYKVLMEIEIEARDKTHLKYMLEESHSISECHKVTIINQSGIKEVLKYGKNEVKK